MAPRHRTLRVAALLLLLPLLLLALWPRGGGAAPELEERALAAEAAPASVVDAATRDGDARSRDVAPDAPDAPARSAAGGAGALGHQIRVRVLDSRGAGVPHVKVCLGPWEPWRVWQTEGTDGDGRALLKAPSRIGPFASLGVQALVPGAFVAEPLSGHDEGEEVVLTLPDIGWLQVDVTGSGEQGGIQFTPWNGIEDQGTTCSASLQQMPVRMAVGLGLQFRVLAWSGGESKTLRPVVGPTAAHETVALAIDFPRARVRFALDGGLDWTAALLVRDKACTRCTASATEDGAFVALVPKAVAAHFVLASGAMSFESPRMDFLGDVDLGKVELSPMRSFGAVEVRLPDGSPAGGQQSPATFLFEDGRRVRASMATGPLAQTEPAAYGDVQLSLRLFSALEFRPSVPGYFAEPPVVMLTGGAVATVQMQRGSEVEIAAADPGQLRTLRLLREADGAKVRVTSAWLDQGRPSWSFTGLRPGEYAIEVEGATAAPSRFLVTAGSQQRVVVVVRPQ
jgi:hypothetical protein